MRLKLFLLPILLCLFLFTSCSDDDDNNLTLPSLVEAYIQKNYANAAIKEMDALPGGGFEVDIWDGGIEKELIFNSSSEWISTSWDIPVRDVPAAISNVLKASAEYASYWIDDADYYQTLFGNYYLIELEKNGVPDVKVKMNEAGDFVK